VADLLILLGSSNDREYFEGVDALTDFFGISYEIAVLSAHRDSDRLHQRLSAASSDGTRIIIAAAGMAAHLAGVCAASSGLPVIGVPLPGSSLNGLDSLLSTVQMPSGVPVATMAIGKHGAKNAVIFSARILALSDEGIRRKIEEFRGRGARL
jgi:phosphoribosylaminoimidazole carboxylase PurE protein